MASDMDQPTARHACTCPRLQEHFAALEAQISALDALQPSSCSDGPPSLSSTLSAALAPPWSAILQALKQYFGDNEFIDLKKVTTDTLRVLMVWLREARIAEDEERSLRVWLVALTYAIADAITAEQASAPRLSASVEPVIDQEATEASREDVLEGSEPVSAKNESHVEPSSRMDDSSPDPSLTSESELELKLGPPRVEQARPSSPDLAFLHRLVEATTTSTSVPQVDICRHAGPSPEAKPGARKRARDAEPSPTASAAALGDASSRSSKRKASFAPASRPRDTTSDGASPGPSDPRRSLDHPAITALHSAATFDLPTTPLRTPPPAYEPALPVEQEPGPSIRRSSRDKVRRSFFDGTPAPSSSLTSTPAPSPAGARKPRSPSPERPLLAPAPAVPQVETDTPFGALLRRTLRLPADVDLSNLLLTDSRYLHLLSRERIGYARQHTGGNRQLCSNGGMTDKVYSTSKHHLSMQPGPNIVRHHIDLSNEKAGVVAAGEPLVFVSHKDRIQTTLECARNTAADRPQDVNVFVCHGSNDWRYMGRYEVAYEGQTPLGAFAELDEEQKALVEAVVKGQTDLEKKEPTWYATILKDWNVRLKPVETAMKDFRTKEEATMPFLVLRCIGWDEDSERVWNEAAGHKEAEAPVAEV